MSDKMEYEFKELKRPRFKSKGKAKKNVKRLRAPSRPPLRRKLDAKKEEERTATQGSLVTKHMNKVLRKNPRANATLSSKKVKKLQKARMHASREANEMAVEIEVTSTQRASQPQPKKKSSAADEDVEIMET